MSTPARQKRARLSRRQALREARARRERVHIAVALGIIVTLYSFAMVAAVASQYPNLFGG